MLPFGNSSVVPDLKWVPVALGLIFLSKLKQKFEPYKMGRFC